MIEYAKRSQKIATAELQLNLLRVYMRELLVWNKCYVHGANVKVVLVTNTQIRLGKQTTKYIRTHSASLQVY